MDKKTKENNFWGDIGEDILEVKPAIKDPWAPERLMNIMMDPNNGPQYPMSDSLHFTCEVNPDVAREWLPENLPPTDPAMATVFMVDYPRTFFGLSYQEAGIFLHCVFEDQEHMLTIWMTLNDDTPLILGREMSGLPKKIADFEIEMNAVNPRGKVMRRGYDVLEVIGSNPQPLEDGELWQLPTLNVLGVPGKEGKLLRGCASHRLHEGQKMDFAVSTGITDFDPLYRLEMPSRVRGEHMIIDAAVPGITPRINLPGGEVGTVSAEWVAANYPFRCY